MKPKTPKALTELDMTALPPKHDHDECHRILRGTHALQAKLDEIVRITDNSPGCDPVAAVRHLMSNAHDMLRELAKLREDVKTWRGIADGRGDKIEELRAELRATAKR